MSPPVLLKIWREVGRHLELPELMDRVFPALGEALPLAALLVRELHVARGVVETVALAPFEAPARAPARVDPVPHAESLASWSRGGPSALGRVSIRKERLEPLVPDDLPRGEIALVPLPPDETEDAAPGGALVLVLHDGASLSADQRALVRELAEPFAAALANHWRVRELRRLREAVEAENRALLRRLGRPGVGDVIVGAETGLRPVLERVQQVAPSDVPVLILGETGSGKEVIARAIHTRSRRVGGPLIRVNCGAIPGELMDSELFGHERGSFTGATGTRQGWFERSDGGTLFLDEVAELPPGAQVRLLRILQDGTFERVGGHAPLTVDVRVVAATHRDLPTMVSSGRFREDLWFRLCVFPIHLPPLRERPEDIPLLATHFALKAARKLGLPPALPSPDDLARLMSYPWPGNVRELNSVIERAAILGEGRRLEVVAALGMPMGAPSWPRLTPDEPTPPPRAADEADLGAAMARHIEGALRACHGRIEGPFGAALRLRVNPHTLRARMRKLGIDWKRYRRQPVR